MELKNISDGMISNSGLSAEKVQQILSNPETNPFRKAQNLLRRAFNEEEKERYKKEYFGKVVVPPSDLIHKLDDAEKLKMYLYLIYIGIEEELMSIENHELAKNLSKKDLSNFLGKTLSHTVDKHDQVSKDPTGMMYLNKFMVDLMMDTAVKRNSKGNLSGLREHPKKLWSAIFSSIEFNRPDEVNLDAVLKISRVINGNAITNFRPMTAAWMYHNLSPKSEKSIIIRDPSAGWMSRLTASFKVALLNPNKKVVYVATDPNPDLVAKKDELMCILKKMAGFGYNNNFEAHLFSHGAEIPEARFSDTFGKMTVIGTSPPYGDTESYNGMDVSILHPDFYKEKFLKPTIENFKYDLAKDGKIWWNIAYSMSSYPNLNEDTLSAFDEGGFELVKTYKYMLARNPLMRKLGKVDHEPIYVFQHKN